MNMMRTIRQLHRQAVETGGALIIPKEGRSAQVQAALNEIRDRRWAGTWDLLSDGRPATALKFPAIADDSFLAALDDTDEMSSTATADAPLLSVNSDEEKQALVDRAGALLDEIKNGTGKYLYFAPDDDPDCGDLRLLERSGRITAEPVFGGSAAYHVRFINDAPINTLADFIDVNPSDSESVQDQNR